MLFIPKFPEDPNPKPTQAPQNTNQEYMMGNMLNMFRNFIIVSALGYLMFISYENQTTILTMTFATLILATLIQIANQIKYQLKIDLIVKESHPELEKIHLAPSVQQNKKIKKELIIITICTLIVSLIIPNL
jgi:hypothetical protein